LTSLNSAEVRSELADSKKLLEDITGQSIDSISYPFGMVTDSITQIAAEVGYHYGFTTRWPYRKAKLLKTEESHHEWWVTRAKKKTELEYHSNLALGRIMIYGFDTPSSVLRKLEGRLQWLERSKQSVTSALAGGTVLFQRLSGRG
jgi:peptidoglycan/xylan/chitin deacetylase (PgdA/CDA1 family)